MSIKIEKYKRTIKLKEHELNKLYHKYDDMGGRELKKLELLISKLKNEIRELKGLISKEKKIKRTDKYNDELYLSSYTDI